MKKGIYLKSTLRQPLRTGLLFLLIVAASFAFVSQAVEYIVTMEETERMGDFYHSIGTLTPIDGWEVSSGAELVESSSYVRFTDRVRRFSGVLEGLYSVNYTQLYRELYPDGSDVPIPDWSNGNDVYFYGTVTSVQIMGQSTTLLVTPDQLMAGNPAYLALGGSIVLSHRQADGTGIFGDMAPGQRYLLRAAATPTLTKTGSLRVSYDVRPVDGDTWYLGAEPEEQFSADDPRLKGLADELALLEANMRAVGVCSTVDLSLSQQTQPSAKLYYLEEGRWIDYEDHLAVRPVCVVPLYFARQQGLAVGDSITMSLRHTPQGDHGQIYASAQENWRTLPCSEPKSFEIVGVYDAYAAPGSSHTTWIWIPESLRPEGYDSYPDSILPNNYSFVLTSSRWQPAFETEMGERLRESGYELYFLPNNAESFWAAATPMQQSAKMNLLIFSAVLLLTLGLCAFLYLHQRRKELAILRALGMPQTIAVGRLLGPMALIGGVAILVGGGLSWRWALSTASESLCVLTAAGEQPGTPAAVELSTIWLLILVAGSLVVLLESAVAGAVIAVRKPVLEQLQGSRKAK